jgi:hypothetical protein
MLSLRLFSVYPLFVLHLNENPIIEIIPPLAARRLLNSL